MTTTVAEQTGGSGTPGATGTPRRRVAVLLVIGLLAGGLMGHQVRQVEDMPSECSEVLASYTAEPMLRTQQSVSPAQVGTGDNPITCEWKSAGSPRDETKRSVTLRVKVGRHRLYGAGTAVKTARAEAELWGTQARPVPIADEAVATSYVSATGAQAYVGVRDGRFSVLVSYRTSDKDRTMALELAELAAVSALPGGPLP